MIKKLKKLRSNFNEKEYEKAENIFLDNTDHIFNVVNFFKKKVLPKINLNDFLDIGPGPGNITKLIAGFFKNTTIVEPNKYFLKNYKLNSYIKYCDKYQKICLSNNFDFILCSHVLYHIDKSERSDFFKKIFHNLAPGGIAIIIHVAPSGEWHKLRYEINKNYISSFSILKELEKLTIFPKVTTIKSFFKDYNIDSFKKLVYLFTIDDCFSPVEYVKLNRTERLEIRIKIERFIDNCKKPDGSYVLCSEDDYIMLQKLGD